MDRARIASMLGGAVALRLRSGQLVHVRPVRTDDADAIQMFVRGLSDAARRLRFFAPIRELTPSMLKRLTGVDGPLDRVLVALANDDGGERVVALAQHAADGDQRCDLALVIADDWQSLGLGRLLLSMLIETAREAGFSRAEGDVLRGNDAMLGLAREFGFAVTRSPFDATMLRITRALDVDRNTTPPPPAAPLLEEEGKKIHPLLSKDGWPCSSRGGWRQLPARSRSPENSSLQKPPPWKRSATGSAASFA
jgi:GNAT superfamily N-acetyltransferase